MVVNSDFKLAPTGKPSPVRMLGSYVIAAQPFTGPKPVNWKEDQGKMEDLTVHHWRVCSLLLRYSKRAKKRHFVARQNAHKKVKTALSKNTRKSAPKKGTGDTLVFFENREQRAGPNYCWSKSTYPLCINLQINKSEPWQGLHDCYEGEGHVHSTYQTQFLHKWVSVTCMSVYHSNLVVRLRKNIPRQTSLRSKVFCNKVC